MSLEIKELSFRDFRNYERLELGNLGNLTIFVGPNGSGKTNILEGIDLLTAASSFRHSLIEQMVRDGAGHALLEARSEGDGRVLDSALHLEKGKKNYTINGKARSTADVRGLLPAVTFVPDDLELAKKSSGVKRDALDDLGCQLTRNYYVVRRDYLKALRYKNRLLKEEAPPLLLDSIDETHVTFATQLLYYRYELFCRMVPIVAENYSRIAPTQEEFSAVYTPSWIRAGSEDRNGLSAKEADYSRMAVKGALESALDEFRSQEVRRARAIIGPHADKIEFFLAGRPVADYASQGQQRSIVLAWKMGEVDIVRRSLGAYPVLLLDDVMSELDTERRALLVELVRQDVQTFITATDLSYFPSDIVEKAHVIELPFE